jgi:hypothetical protein
MLHLSVIFTDFIFKSFSFFEVNIRWSFNSFLFNRQFIIIPQIDNPDEVILGYKSIFDEMFELSNISGHKISFFDSNFFFLFRHCYNKEY